MIGPFSALFFFKDDSTLLLVTCAANAAHIKYCQKCTLHIIFCLKKRRLVGDCTIRRARVCAVVMVAVAAVAAGDRKAKVNCSKAFLLSCRRVDLSTSAILFIEYSVLYYYCLVG